MIERETPGGPADDSARSDSFDTRLLLYGVVFGPAAALLGAAIATLAGATRTVTVLAAITAVILAGFLADPALRRLRSPSWR